MVENCVIDEKFRPLGVTLFAFNAKLFRWISYVHKFNLRIVFSKFLEWFMYIFVPWCQLYLGGCNQLFN